ncbi:MAG: CBS domain-containing protein [Fimbriimonadaceae bacterium]|nr:CBS domain-containing protein [Fimbriimonadaceae bacterium]
MTQSVPRAWEVVAQTFVASAVTSVSGARFAVLEPDDTAVTLLMRFATNTDADFCVLVKPGKGIDGRDQNAAIVTRRDLNRRGESAFDHGTSPVMAVKKTVTISAALNIMNGHNSRGQWVNHLPVIDDKRKFVAVLTRARLTAEPNRRLASV